MSDYQRIAVSGLSGSAGDVLVVEVLERRLDDSRVVRDFFIELKGVLKESAAKNIVLDLTRLRYCSSIALNRLINLDDDIRAAGGELRLCGLNADLTDILSITRLNQRFSIVQDKNAAVVSF